MTVRVCSPDDTVRLYLTGGGQLHLEFARGSLLEHTESSLSKQLSHVCTMAVRRRRQGMATAVREAIADMDSDEDDTFTRQPPPTRAAPSEPPITALGRSPRSLVTVRRIPGAIFDIKVRKGTLARFNAEQVIAEFHEAFNAAATDYKRQAAALRKSGAARGSAP
ncbi:hypothetical protein [Stackebrandtia sp.]|uniref:hypothetical protein n=1 Tax=Stackebrandtia sp. TaxID=2023065 RepID=UPI002D79C11B|nr:hypothetical protein [Stackebrandtia sp.]